jgi:hypothetical protein
MLFRSIRDFNSIPIGYAGRNSVKGLHNRSPFGYDDTERPNHVDKTLVAQI